MALTVLYVPYSLDSHNSRVPWNERPPIRNPKPCTLIPQPYAESMSWRGSERSSQPNDWEGGRRLSPGSASRAPPDCSIAISTFFFTKNRTRVCALFYSNPQIPRPVQFETRQRECGAVARPLSPGGAPQASSTNALINCVCRNEICNIEALRLLL